MEGVEHPENWNAEIAVNAFILDGLSSRIVSILTLTYEVGTVIK